VSSFGRSTRLAKELNYADNVATSLVISGLWTASYHMGGFLGPTTAGFMVQAWGFRSTTWVFFFVFLAMTGANVAEIILKKNATRAREISVSNVGPTQPIE
jgi:MFS family permease